MNGVYCNQCEFFCTDENDYLRCEYVDVKIGFNMDDLYKNCPKKQEWS